MSRPRMQMRFLRIFLGFCAIAWGASVFGVFLSWPMAEEALRGLGAQPIFYDRMLDYWLRMAAGAFTLVGGLYLLLALQPAKFLAVIPWFGALMLIEGLILLVHGIRLALPPLPFYADTAACFVGGSGVLWYWRGAVRDREVRTDQPDAVRKDEPVVSPPDPRRSEGPSHL